VAFARTANWVACGFNLRAASHSAVIVRRYHRDAAARWDVRPSAPSFRGALKRRTRNDGAPIHDNTFSRRYLGPSFASSVTLFETEGAGKAGWPLHPGPPRKGICASARRPQVQAGSAGLPCAVVYGLYALSPVNQRLPPSSAQCVCRILANLAPAWARQDHTTSPSANDAARRSAHSRPPHPRLTCRDDRDTSLCIEAGYERRYGKSEFLESRIF